MTRLSLGHNRARLSLRSQDDRQRDGLFPFHFRASNKGRLICAKNITCMSVTGRRFIYATAALVTISLWSLLESWRAEPSRPRYHPRLRIRIHKRLLGRTSREEDEPFIRGASCYLWPQSTEPLSRGCRSPAGTEHELTHDEYE